MILKIEVVTYFIHYLLIDLVLATYKQRRHDICYCVQIYIKAVTIYKFDIWIINLTQNKKCMLVTIYKNVDLVAFLDCVVVL